MKRNILIYENGKYYKWDIQHIQKNNDERIPVYIGTDEKGVMTIYNPEKMHDYYFKKYIESVKQKAVDDLKSFD